MGTIEILQRELTEQRKRIVGVIEDKSMVEQELDKVKIAKRELSEQLKSKSR